MIPGGAESAHIPVKRRENDGGADKIERVGIFPCAEMSLLIDYTPTSTQSGNCYHVYQPGRKSHEMLHDAIRRIRVACQCNWRGRAPGEAYALAIPRRHSTAYPATGPPKSLWFSFKPGWPMFGPPQPNPNKKECQHETRQCSRPSEMRQCVPHVAPNYVYRIPILRRTGRHRTEIQRRKRA